MSTSKALQKKGHPNEQQPPTPSITKRKQAQQRNTFKSPTDSLMSPCSQRLLKKKFLTDFRAQDGHTIQQGSTFAVEEKENEVS